MSWKSHTLLLCPSHDWCSQLICINAHCTPLLLCGFSENRLKREEFTAWPWLRPFPLPEPAPNHRQSGQGAEHTHHGRAGFAWAAGRIDPLARIGAAQASQPGPAPLLSLRSADSWWHLGVRGGLELDTQLKAGPLTWRHPWVVHSVNSVLAGLVLRFWLHFRKLGWGFPLGRKVFCIQICKYLPILFPFAGLPLGSASPRGIRSEDWKSYRSLQN